MSLTKAFREPDLNAPRFRPKAAEILNIEFYKAFRKEHPKYAYLKDAEIREIIYRVNGKIWETAIEYRDGVELPEQLGYIFIASFPHSKRSNNINYKLSKKIQYEVKHRNWESDQYLAKIVYTNHGSKYRFKYSNLWGFDPVRQFSRTVAKVYPEEFKKYVILDNYKRINEIFRKNSFKMYINKVEQDKLAEYDEFNFD